MPTETGNSRYYAFVPEKVFGQTPATPVGQLLRWTPDGTSFGSDRTVMENPEMRTDNMYAAGRGGALRPKGNLGGKLSYGTYDLFLAYALGQPDFAADNTCRIAPMVTSGAISIAAAAAGKTFTRATGSFVTDGFAVGQTICTYGFTNGGNNSTFVISAVTATVITCSTATGMVDESSAAGRTIMLNTRPSFTLEEGHKTTGIYFPFLGCVIDGFEMSGKVDQPVDIKFNVIGKSAGNEATSSLFSSFTQPNTNDLITTWEGSIKSGGNALPTVVGWSLKVDRNSSVASVCGGVDLYDIQPGRAKVTGSLELWWDRVDFHTAYRAEQDIAFQINLGGASKGYQNDLTRCRITKASAPPKDGMETQTVEFESVVPLSGATTSYLLTRKP